MQDTEAACPEPEVEPPAAEPPAAGPPPEPWGRPTDYSDGLAEAICGRITEGWSLLRIGEEEGMPSRQTLHRWMRELPEFARQIHQARLWRDEINMDRVLRIEERLLSGAIKPSVARAALASLQWRLARTAPRK